jgi:DNA-binding FrmR family transcriptional regulator
VKIPLWSDAEEEKKNLLNRVRRIKGQAAPIERALDQRLADDLVSGLRAYLK